MWRDKVMVFTNTIKTMACLLMFMLMFTGISSAQSIQERMKTRLPDIVALKGKGIIAENNKGFLEFRAEEKEKEDVVAAENSDRRRIYEKIATRQKTTAELVGKRRAAQIAKKAAQGEWLQDPAGKWFQKQ
jgi:uncharacterized protein YdbL (DUF1318 family)